MRRFLMSLGAAGLVAGSAAAQFGAPPATSPTPMMPPAAGPFGSPAPTAVPAPTYVPPVGGLQPANGFRPAGAAPLVAPVELPLALGPNHPLAVKPDDGAYFICVRSYSRPARPDPNDPGFTVKELAEELAADIQQTQRTRVFLYELVSDEKKAQIAAQTAARQRAAEFAAAVQQFKQRGTLQGADYIELDDRVKYQTFHYRDQVAVLVGGFRTEEEAVKALGVVKKWAAPKATKLLDGASYVVKRPDGKSEITKGWLNPYATAMVVQNPTVTKQLSAQPQAQDPFLIKLNEGRPYNLLKTSKKWTLAVKSFSAPVHYVTKENESSSRYRDRSDDVAVLRAGTNQAEALAKALREMKDRTGKSLNIEAFVLHTRTASLVTVGDYDTPTDPDLLEKQRLLSGMTFNLSRDDKGMQITGTGEKMFGDMIQPVPIPRRQ